MDTGGEKDLCLFLGMRARIFIQHTIFGTILSKKDILGLIMVCHIGM